MSDEAIRLLERAAAESREGILPLKRALRRLGQAFEDCDECWGDGFRIISSNVVRCEFCLLGAPKKRETKHIADEEARFRGGSHWRWTAHQACKQALAALPVVVSEKGAKAALKEAYPFGQRAYHPYKIWCDEVRKQLVRRFGPPERALEIPLFAAPPAGPTS